jgi:hypothetical protein
MMQHVLHVGERGWDVMEALTMTSATKGMTLGTRNSYRRTFPDRNELGKTICHRLSRLIRWRLSATFLQENFHDKCY